MDRISQAARVTNHLSRIFDDMAVGGVDIPNYGEPAWSREIHKLISTIAPCFQELWVVLYVEALCNSWGDKDKPDRVMDLIRAHVKGPQARVDCANAVREWADYNDPFKV